MYALFLLVLAFFLGKGACDSTCPNGITNITGSTGTLTYPSSGDYGVNETKCWKIEVPDTYGGIAFMYSRYMIEPCSGCECDYIQISKYYGFLNYASKECGRYSAGYLVDYRSSVGAPVASSNPSNTVWIRFKSDETVHHKGFNFTYIAVSASGGEKSYLNASEDETIEFGTPKVGIEKYPKSYKQQWFLIVPEGRQVLIDFDTFELEQSENCKNDYVEFREASAPNTFTAIYGPILTKRLCGSTKPSSIQSAGNMVWVQFMSDSNSTTVYKGFKASFKAGQGRLSISNPLTLLFISALLTFASKKSVF